MIDIHKYLVEQFEINKDTSATIIITLFIFCIGVLIQQALKIFDAWLRRKKLRKIFFQVLIEHVKELKDQSEIYSKNAETFEFKNELGFEIKQGSVNACKVLHELGFKDCYEAFFFGFENWLKTNGKYKRKAFYTIWGIISSTEKWFFDSYEKMDAFLVQYNKYNEARNAAIDNHRQLTDKLIHDLNRTGASHISSYSRDFMNIISQWHKTKNATRPDIVNEELVQKLLALNKHHVSNPIVLDSNTSLLKASFEFQNQQSLLLNQKAQSISDYQLFRKNYRLSKKSFSILK